MGPGGQGTPTPNSSAPHAPRSRNWARTRLAHRRHPARRARRQAIGLPRFSDPEDLKAVANSAPWVGAPLGACHQHSRSPTPIAAGHRPCRHLRFRRNPGKLRYLHAVPLALGWVRPFSGANPGSQLVVVVTEVLGSGAADVRACRVEETT